MAKDPAFLFYPGDYLRDTQCLSEQSQVAYDRIMCEHMRNICITQQQLKFFTKRLTEDEREELDMILTKIDGGYQIDWVVDSILKRRAYSESRRKNRKSKAKKISKTYDSHMENENEIDNSIVITNDNIKELENNFSMKEEVGRMLKTTPKIVDNLLTEFIQEQKASDTLNRPMGDLRHHFVQWSKKTHKKTSKKKLDSTKHFANGYAKKFNASGKVINVNDGHLPPIDS